MSKPKDTDRPLALLRECFVLDPDVVSGALWRFRVILAVAAFALAGCNANQAINPRTAVPRMMPTAILKIPSSTHRTPPGSAAKPPSMQIGDAQQPPISMQAVHKANERGERLVWLEAAMVDRLDAMRILDKTHAYRW